jgi:amino acid adenylation domain-containing protein
MLFSRKLLMSCHSALVPLAGQATLEVIGERLGSAARLWVDDIPAGAADAISARRRATELTRPVQPGQGRPVRAVLLRYADGTRDLVLVAQRAHPDGLRLRNLAGRAWRAVGTGADARRGPGPAWGACLDQPVPYRFTEDGQAARPDWGLGSPGGEGTFATYRVRDDNGSAKASHASWVTALGLTLSRYEDTRQPLVATARIGGEMAMVPVAADQTATLGMACERVQARLGQLPAPGVSAPADTMDGAAMSGSVVGLILIPADEADFEYYPYLAPPLPLTIFVVEDKREGVDVVCWYDRSSFGPAVVTQFAHHLLTAHRLVTGSPSLSMAEADVLGPAEQRRVADLGRSPQPLSTTPACIHRRFAAQAASHPDAPAVSCPEQRLSYAELDERADYLARGLRSLGVRVGDRVGICLDRSADLVASILAVLKCGASYLPMDPRYPGDRLAFMLQDSGAAVVIAEPGELSAATVIDPRELAKLGAGSAVGPPESSVGPADPAYIIYTSGSTGRPKGVVVPHANVISLLDATREQYELGDDDVWTLFHSSAFDFSVWEIWGCLLTGGHLVVVPYWVSRSPDKFHELLHTEHVTVLSQTPSAFAQLIEVDRRQAAPLAVRLVVLGGEALAARMLLPWFDRHPESSCSVVNMFGITETTVHVTAETMTRRHALEASRAVGRPLPGWRLYVLDRHGRLAPPGVAGEIYVGGAGVASHYLNRQELTEERFLTDPFAGGRMYRSGDKGRMGPDGRLEHLGRLDHQVKVRGFRIELDEIRSVLLDDPAVASAAVIIRQDTPDDTATARIDAYLVLDSGTVAEVRKRIARVLPDYMLPATVTAMPELPLTSNGKLDITRLPIHTEEPEPPVENMESGGLTERLLDVWRYVLGVSVRPSDNFFDMGGNSLLAVRMSNVMRERGLPSLPLQELYLNPTVHGLAAVLVKPTPEDITTGSRLGETWI